MPEYRGTRVPWSMVPGHQGTRVPGYQGTRVPGWVGHFRVWGELSKKPHCTSNISGDILGPVETILNTCYTFGTSTHLGNKSSRLSLAAKKIPGQKADFNTGTPFGILERWGREAVLGGIASDA